MRQGQQAKACLTMLFRNSGPTSLVVRNSEIVGKAMLIRTGKVDMEWKKEVERATLAHLLQQGVRAAHNNINVRGQGKPDIKAPITNMGRELAKQLNLDNNEVPAPPPQAKECVRQLVNAYESVLTDEDVAVGHTELVKMDINLT